MSNLREQVENCLKSHGAVVPLVVYDILKECLDALPEWISIDKELPKEEPHRNVEIAYCDAAGKVFSGLCSTRLIKAVNCFAWREEQPLPIPPDE